jgi:Skp family chaperone for outer membrane proteins
MNSIEKEEQEYKKFMFELVQKVYELEKDFNKLSDDNKKKVLSEVDKAFAAKGLAGVLNYIIRQN